MSEYLKPIKCNRCKSELSNLFKFIDKTIKEEKIIYLCDDCVKYYFTKLLIDRRIFNKVWNLINENSKKTI